jgi:molybdopterin molybdotransferase
MLTLAEAQARILSDVTPLGVERVHLDDAVMRVLAEDAIASVPLPPFDNSAMDGYAIELGSGGKTRTVAHESRAGGPLPPPLAKGTAMRIFTGAPLPSGADAIVMQEQTSREGETLTLTGAPRPGDHVRHAGEDLAVGKVAVARGTRLRARHLPLLAAQEIVRPRVHRRPIVTVLATGDELREPGTPARPGTIVETNALAVAAMARAVGADVRVLPIAPDDQSALEAALLSALDGADLALTIGGVSVGDHDLVKDVLETCGVKLDFWKVAIKPGKPLAMGRRERTRVLGLPGNPVSAMVTFHMFAAPLLRALQGETHPLPPARKARLGKSIRHAPGRLELVRAKYGEGAEAGTVTPIASQSSGSLVSMAWADALVVVPLESEGLSEGSIVDVVDLG